MSDKSNSTIESLLASTNFEEIRQGLKLSEKEFAQNRSLSARGLLDVISTLFYIDPLDMPELVPVVEEAIDLVARFGKSSVPILLEKLDEGDLKSQIAIAQTLGRIGVDAIEPLISAYKSSEDSSRRSFILYALGKVKSPKVILAAECALEAAESGNVELRDTATRAIGKFVESIPPHQLPRQVKSDFLEKLHKNLADTNHGIRAKAIRSLGKLAKFGHLSSEEKVHLEKICKRIIGVDEAFEWDRAYVVRKEAEEALGYTK
ncbi:MAG: HEAT repeat domain-containing protein [Ignavibacteriales bacterium]|nr:HEAT repeat domain-containing protein [Ignavibacteriales bacterium]